MGARLAGEALMIALHQALQERLNKILRRHIREEDAMLSDDDFLAVVMRRYHAARIAPIIDPNE